MTPRFLRAIGDFICSIFDRKWDRHGGLWTTDPMGAKRT
jgi:hypothetical protein